MATLDATCKYVDYENSVTVYFFLPGFDKKKISARINNKDRTITVYASHKNGDDNSPSLTVDIPASAGDLMAGDSVGYTNGTLSITFKKVIEKPLYTYLTIV